MKMVNSTKRNYISILTFIIICLLANPKWAISQDFEVAPVKIFFNAEPGESQGKRVMITNHASKRTGFNVNVSSMNINTGGAIAEEESVDRSCAEWLNVNMTYFELDPNESKYIEVNIEVPKNEFSTKWANIYVTTAKERSSFSADKQLGTGILVTGRIAITVIQSPTSNSNYNAKISNFKETRSTNRNERWFNIKLSNTGDKIFTAKVFLIASNLETAEEFKTEQQNIKVYPGKFQETKLILPDNLNLPSGRYALAAIADYHKGSNLEGAQLIIDVIRINNPTDKDNLEKREKEKF